MDENDTLRQMREAFNAYAEDWIDAENSTVKGQLEQALRQGWKSQNQWSRMRAWHKLCGMTKTSISRRLFGTNARRKRRKGAPTILYCAMCKEIGLDTPVTDYIDGIALCTHHTNSSFENFYSGRPLFDSEEEEEDDAPRVGYDEQSRVEWSDLDLP